jgi:hypothetical protein
VILANVVDRGADAEYKTVKAIPSVLLISLPFSSCEKSWTVCCALLFSSRYLTTERTRQDVERQFVGGWAYY